MDSRGLPMYQHPRMTMMGQSYIGSVPGSVPLNIPMGNPVQETMGIPGAPMTEDHSTLTHKTHLNKMPVQQNYSQLPLRKEVDDEGRICGVVLPETPTQLLTETQLPIQENNFEIGEDSQEEIKTEVEEDISYFMEASHDIFLKIRRKDITIKAAAEILERPYSFVYTRYQEFCDNASEEDEPKKKKVKKKGGRKKGRPKKLNWGNNKPRKSGKVFECDDCPGIFYSEYQIKAHSKLHLEEEESHTCTACGVVFPKLFHLMRHRIEVHEEALQCPHCDMQFTIIVSYRHHVKTHAEVRAFLCKECGQGFHSKFHLECHVRKHTGERPFMCGYCEKTFMTLHNLKTHQYVHNGRPDLKKFDCEQCGKKFESNYAVMEHMNTHTGARPYACDMCDARFNFKAGLDRHNMTHTGVQPYKCDLCPAAFYQKKDLEQHKVAHTGIKPYKCDLCDYSCTRKHNLEYHKYTHSGETPFKCDFYGCTAEYSRPNSLKHHKLQHGPPPPRPCKMCHEKFPDLISLKRHMMIHTGEKPQTCEQCFKVFYDKSSLKRHMYSHMYKPPGSKTKQVRQSRKNPVVKRVVKPENTLQKWGSEYQVPTAAENGHNMFAQSLATNAEDTNSQHSQPSFHPFTAVSQYSNLVNNSWPSTMDPDELRRRLLSSFK